MSNLPIYLLDTDVVIDIQRGHPPAIAWFSTLSNLPSIPGLVVMELIQDAHNAVQVQQALKLIAPFPVVWPAKTECERALADFRRYHLSHNLGLIDSLIGACTLGQSMTLCTFNLKHYSVIAELKIEQPYTR